MKGLAEWISSSKLAQEKGTSSDVKVFADMMVKDQRSANEKLKALATNVGDEAKPWPEEQRPLFYQRPHTVRF